MTDEQIKELKLDDKLIFIEYGGVLSTDKGNVYTFSNMRTDYLGHKTWYWQCKELIDMGNDVHNFSIIHVELFDPKKHTEYNIMDSVKILQDEKEFTMKFGS